MLRTLFPNTRSNTKMKNGSTVFLVITSFHGGTWYFNTSKKGAAVSLLWGKNNGLNRRSYVPFHVPLIKNPLHFYL